MVEDERLAAWKEALQAMERDLENCEHYLNEAQGEHEQNEEHDVPEPTFQPPAQIGPLPVQYEAWARSILVRHDDVVSRLGAASHELKKHSYVVESLISDTDASPLYFDEQA